MQTSLYTFSDVLISLADWCGSTTTDAGTLRKIKRAVESAYRDIANTRRWAYFIGRNRLTTVASYSTGTITYTNSTRAVTLASGTFPTWSAFGTFQVSGVEYPVASYDSATQITLSVNNNPGADVAAGTSYRLWRDTYPLPVDFLEIGTIKDASRNITLQEMEPNDFVAERLYNTTPTLPRYFTITSDPHYTGAMAIRLYLPPDAIYQYDYMYHRRPRPLLNPQYNTGTITSSATTLTGTGTTWTSSMIGCVIRTSSTATTLPTGTDGSNPFVYQRIITAFTSATSVTIDQAFDAEVSGVKYEISDPIDIESGAMYSAFLRKCEMELGTIQRRADVPALNQVYQASLQQAMEADNRSFDRKPAGMRLQHRVPQYYDITNATS